MNKQHYETFVSLAETKNFSMTAKKLYIVQSTVSNRIKEIEAKIGKPLFIRTNKSVSLTVAGEVFLQYAKRALAIESDMRDELKNLRYTSRIKIGSPHAIYSGHLLPLIQNFMKKNQDISIKVKISHTGILLEDLSDDIVDLAVVTYLPRNIEIESLASFSEPVVLIAQNTESFKSTMTWSELAESSLIYADLGLGFDQFVKDRVEGGLSYRLYIDQINEVIRYVEEGMGYGFVPLSLVDQRPNKNKLKIVDMDGDSYQMKHYMIAKKGNSSLKYIEELLNK